jgi:hypothetical protein
MAPLTRSRAKLDFCAASPASVKDAAPSAPVETAFAGLRRGLAIDAAYAGHFIKSMFPASLPALVFAIVAVCTYRDYGLNWDEGLQADLGLCSWSYYLSFGANTDVVTIMWDAQHYGPMVEMLLVAPHKYFGLPLFESRHALIALISTLNIAGTQQIARLLCPSRGGDVLQYSCTTCQYFAALSMVCSPVFYGHAFTNSKVSRQYRVSAPALCWGDCSHHARSFVNRTCRFLVRSHGRFLPS